MPRRSERWLVALARRVLTIFFRRIEVEGLERVPRHGPLLVVANHVNGLLDPMLVLGTLPRVPRFLGKSGLWQIAPLRPLLAWARVIPVYRPGDPGVDPGKNAATFVDAAQVLADGGAVSIFPEGRSHNEPGLTPLKTGAARIALAAEALRPGLGLHVLPVGLVFDAKERFRSRALVEIGEPFRVTEPADGAAAEIDASSAAATAAAAVPDASAGAVDGPAPRSDASTAAANGPEDVFDASATAANGPARIFDASATAADGPARIFDASATAAAGTAPVSETSSAAADGPTPGSGASAAAADGPAPGAEASAGAVEPPAWPLDRPGAAAADPAAVRALTARIDAALDRVTVSYDTWDEARLIGRAAEIWARPALDVPRRPRLAALADAQRAFVSGYRLLAERHPERLAEVAAAVRRYDRLLHAAGLRDAQVASEYPVPPVARFLRRTLGTQVVRLPLAAVGTALNVVPFLAVRLLVRRVRGADQKATWKVFLSLLLYPLTWIAEAVAAGWLAGRAAGAAAGVAAALVVLVAAPASGLLALRFHDRRSRLAAEARAYLLLRTRRRFAAELRAERRDLHRRVSELVDLHARETARVGGR